MGIDGIIVLAIIIGLVIFCGVKIIQKKKNQDREEANHSSESHAYGSVNLSSDLSDPEIERTRHFARDKKISKQSMRHSPASRMHEDYDDDGNPLAAALMADALGGDPMTAGMTTLVTGDTGVGVFAGLLSSDHEEVAPSQFQDGGSGGGGAGRDLGDNSKNEPMENETVADDNDNDDGDSDGGDGGD